MKKNPVDRFFRKAKKIDNKRSCKHYLAVKDKVEVRVRCKPVVEGYSVVCQNIAPEEKEGNPSERDAAEGLQQEGQTTDGDQLWTVLTPVLCTLVLISVFFDTWINLLQILG